MFTDEMAETSVLGQQILLGLTVDDSEHDVWWVDVISLNMCWERRNKLFDTLEYIYQTERRHTTQDCTLCMRRPGTWDFIF